VTSHEREYNCKDSFRRVQVKYDFFMMWVAKLHLQAVAFSAPLVFNSAALQLLLIR
jgi:hypothetical protein